MDEHVERPDELSACEELKYRLAACRDVFAYTKNLDEE
jgi:hypothetical protein